MRGQARSTCKVAFAVGQRSCLQPIRAHEHHAATHHEQHVVKLTLWLQTAPPVDHKADLQVLGAPLAEHDDGKTQQLKGICGIDHVSKVKAAT